MKQFFWILFGVFQATVIRAYSQERTVGVFNITTEATEGYTLFSPSANNNVYLIDNCGQLMHEWETTARPGNALYLMPDGSLYRAARRQNMQIVAGGGGGVIEKFNWDGDLVWSYTYNSPSYRAHHDFQVLPNGNVLILAWEVKPQALCIENGRNPELLSEGALWPEKIIEVKPTDQESGDIVWEWNAWDHMIQDFDPSRQNYGVIADHPEKININYIRPGVDGADWQHANALDYNPDLDQIMISVLFFDEIWVIDHGTTTTEAAGPQGDLLFRWGNPKAYNRGDVNDQQLFGQHNAHWIKPGLPDAGKVMIFNNGVNRPEGIYSSVLKLNMTNSGLDYATNSSGQFLPNLPEWEYKATPNTSFYSRFISGAHQLENGHTLVTDGAHGTFFEINTNKEEVWRYVSPLTIFGTATQGNIVTNPNGDGTNTVFRATKYPKDYLAFLGRNLTPGAPIEMNPDLTPCTELEQEIIDETTEQQILMYPNPAQDQIYLTNYQGSIEIWDIQGRLHKTSTVVEQQAVNIADLYPGIYFIKLNGVAVKKLIIKD